VAVRRSTQERAARLLEMLSDLSLRPERMTRIAIKDKGRVVFVDSGELVSAEAHGNYVLLQQKSGSYLLRETISGIAEKLRPYGFIRIHRSVLVSRSSTPSSRVPAANICCAPRPAGSTTWRGAVEATRYRGTTRPGVLSSSCLRSRSRRE
jgi:hypothetical protein